MERFPVRPAQASWTASTETSDRLAARLSAPPFVVASASGQGRRRAGLVNLLRWLEGQRGDTWHQRWLTSGADKVGNIDWRHLASQGLRGRGHAGRAPQGEFIELGRGMLVLLGADVIRPSLAWLVTPGGVKDLVTEMARSRDPDGFAALVALVDAKSTNTTKQTALGRIAVVLAAKGGTIADITVGDCLEVVATVVSARRRADTSLYFYQLLHAAGTFPPDAPPTVRVFAGPGQQSVEQLVDRYDFACGPIRDLMVAYLRERQPALLRPALTALRFSAPEPPKPIRRVPEQPNAPSGRNGPDEKPVRTP